jgi:hypothetical protein
MKRVFDRAESDLGWKISGLRLELCERADQSEQLIEWNRQTPTHWETTKMTKSVPAPLAAKAR